jgi:hypothetical protein
VRCRPHWGRFRALALGDAPARREALGLVRGRPFADCDWPWATTDGIIASIESEVADLAASIGEEDLERGDHEGALQALEAGLSANPYDERLYCLVMRAYYAAGNLSGVRATMARLSALVESDIEPVESLQEATRALYSSLTSRLRFDQPPAATASRRDEGGRRHRR